MGNQPLITIGFSSHRVEAIPFARRLIKNYDVVILEEAYNPKFKDMLNKKLSIDEYLREESMEFPEFSCRMYALLQELHLRGKEILQIEPYMGRLMDIYEMFSEGKEPADVLKILDLREVYNAERIATGALLHFYEASMGKPFFRVIEAMKDFAKADAERFRLRDAMRAEAIARILPEDKKVYIETGLMHILLERALRRACGKQWEIKSILLLGSVIKKLTGGEKVTPPGDILTTHYMSRRKDNEEYETLLAARSLIYILLLKKEEMRPTRAEKTPHVKDEIRTNELVNRLSLTECRELYSTIRFQKRSRALEIVKNYLGQ